MIEQAYAEYTDKYGMISGTKNPQGPSGNAILETVFRLWVLKAHAELKPKHIQEFVSQIKSNCQIRQGFYKRNAELMDQQGQDDIVGLSTTGALGAPFSLDILAAVEAERWGPFKYYVPNYPEYQAKFNQRAWLGKFVAMINNCRVARGAKPSLLWCLTVATTGLFGPKAHENGGQDAWRLSALLVLTYETAGTRSWLGDWACSVFKKNAVDTWNKEGLDYGQAIRNCHGNYFANLDHPTARFWK